MFHDIYFQKMTSVLIVACLILTCVGPSLSESIKTDLPDLKNQTFSFREDMPLNVTVGQQFSISVPQFDIETLPKDFSVYQLSQEKFITLFETMEKHEGGSNQESRTKIEGKQFHCDVSLPNMEIQKTLSVLSSKSSNRFNFASEEDVIYVPIKSRGLLYSLDTSTMVISVHHFTPRKLNFLSSAKVNYINVGGDQKVAMASDSSEETVYVFSSSGMWAIKTKTVLTNVDKIVSFQGYDSRTMPVDKLYHGSYGYLYGLKRHQTVYLIPESKQGDRKMIAITDFQGVRLFPQDLYLDGRMLYILDTNRGVYIYKIMGDGKVEPYDHINTNTYGNKDIIVKQASIMVKYVDQQGHKIIELSYQSQSKTASLVRYYKQDQVILQMSIQAVPVTGHNGQVTGQLMLFFVSETGQIEAYPYNIDPRVIQSVHNGVKMHIEGAKKLIYLYQDIYIVVTNQGLLYTQIAINYPRLVCKLPQSTGHVYYEFQFSTDISTCELFDRSLTHKKLFNSNCKVISTYGLFVNDPELSKFQKVILYGVVSTVVIGFIVGLLCLIQWRNNKLSLIGRIKDEIIRFRDRHRRMQPFVEEEPDKNKGEVVFQMPAVEPVPNDE